MAFCFREDVHMYMHICISRWEENKCVDDTDKICLSEDARMLGGASSHCS